MRKEENTHAAPEESYSRHLDHEVAAQEYPYGHPYKMQFMENEKAIKRGELNRVSKLKKGY